VRILRPPIRTQTYTHSTQPSPQVLELPTRLERASSADAVLSSSVKHLPQELLLLIADLLRPSSVYSADDDDLGASEPDVKPHPPHSLFPFLAEAEAAVAKQQLRLHASPLLHLSTRLCVLVPPPTEPPSREDLEFRSRLLLVVGRFTPANATFVPAAARDHATGALSFQFPFLLPTDPDSKQPSRPPSSPPPSSASLSSATSSPHLSRPSSSLTRSSTLPPVESSLDR
jgi:hypothetical protein